MRKLSSVKVTRTVVKRQMIALGKMLALRGGEVKSSRKSLNTLASDGGNNMQIVCADDCVSGLESDKEYMKYLTLCRESNHHPYLLERETSPLRIMYNVDKEPTDRSKGKEVNEKCRGRRRSTVFRKEVVLRGRKIDMAKTTTIKVEPTSSGGKEKQQEKEVARRGRKPKNHIKVCKLWNEESSARRKEKPQTIFRASKRLRAEKINSVVNTKDTQQEKEASLLKNTIKLEPISDVNTQQENKVSRRGRKPKNWNSFKPCKLENEERSARREAKAQTILRASKRLKTEKIIPVVNTKDTQRKIDDARQGKKSSVSSFKACKKDNEESSAKRKGKSHTLFRASKRLKTEKGSADLKSITKTTKDTNRKKEEAPQERKISLNKNNAVSKSISNVKDNLLQSFKPHKKENEESRSLIDKSYEYFLSFLRNSVTVVETDPKVNPQTDIVSLSDPDIIAVSNCPFSDGGGYSPFEASKDSIVIDLEDRIEPDNLFNSWFSKKLLDILKQPYDKNEFLQRCHEASHKKQMTRSRQLRDGREIEYNVDHQLGPSYLDRYPDFKRVFRRCRYGKDDYRALNLLRGFFFYFENIVLEGAFKPWLHETRVMRECRDIVCTPQSP